MSSRDAILLFIRESCRLEDVPVTFYRLQKVRGHKVLSEGLAVGQALLNCGMLGGFEKCLHYSES